MNARRRPYTHTLPEDLMDALEVRAKETGEHRSRLMEQGARLLLALPAAPVDEDEERTLAPTRSEVALLDTMKALGPGAQRMRTLVEKTALSYGVAIKAMRALERRGEAFAWAELGRDDDGAFYAWGTSAPMDAVHQRIAQWQREHAAAADSRAQRDSLNQLTLTVADLCEFIEDVVPVKALVSEATGLAISSPRVAQFKNWRDLEAIEKEEQAANAAAWHAQQELKVAEESRRRLEASAAEAERRRAHDPLAPPPRLTD